MVDFTERAISSASITANTVDMALKADGSSLVFADRAQAGASNNIERLRDASQDYLGGTLITPVRVSLVEISPDGLTALGVQQPGSGSNVRKATKSGNVWTWSTFLTLNYVQCMKISPDGKWLALYFFTSTETGGTFRIYDLATGTQAFTAAFTTRDIVWSADSRFLILVGPDSITNGNGRLVALNAAGTGFTITVLSEHVGYMATSATRNAADNLYVTLGTVATAKRGVQVFQRNGGPANFTLVRREQSTVFDIVPGLDTTTLVAFINELDYKDFLFVADTAAPNGYWIYKYEPAQSRFLRQPDGALALGTISKAKFAPFGRSMLVRSSASPNLKAYSFPEFRDVKSVTISGDLPFIDFDAVALPGIAANVSADLPFIDLDAAVATARDTLPPGQVRVFPAAITVEGRPAIARDQPPPSFGYIEADLPFADFEATVYQKIEVAVSADLPFVDFAASAKQPMKGNISGDLPWIDFDVVVELEKLDVEISGDLPFSDMDILARYGILATVAGDLPWIDFDGMFGQTIAGEISGDLPWIDVNIRVAEPIKATVSGDLPYVDFDATAGARYKVTVAGDLPYLDFDAEAYVEKLAVVVDADLPYVDFDIEAEWPLGILVSADLPFADFEAAVKVPLGVFVAADLPFADFDGSYTKFYRIDLNATLPFIDFDARMGYPTKGNISGDLPFCDFDGLYRPYYKVGVDADLPFADLDIDMRYFYKVVVDGDLPGADLDGEYKRRYKIEVDGDLPGADLDGLIELRYYVEIDGDLPFIDLWITSVDKRSNRPAMLSPNVGNSKAFNLGGGMVIGNKTLVKAG